MITTGVAISTLGKTKNIIFCFMPWHRPFIHAEYGHTNGIGRDNRIAVDGTEIVARFRRSVKSKALRRRCFCHLFRPNSCRFSLVRRPDGDSSLAERYTVLIILDVAA